MLVRRALPHTPAKRWAYGMLLLLAVAMAALGKLAIAAAVVVVLCAVRWWDVRRSGARRGSLPTSRAYFFEGEDDHLPRKGR